MANYTPTDQFDFNNIPLTGVLIPGATVGYIAESKFIKGGYIVVRTIEERDALLDKSLYEDREIAVGTPVFVSDENKTYRYMGEDSGPDLWLEDTADLQQITENISDLQQIVLNQKTEIDEKASQDDLSALANATANSFTGVEVSVNAINSNIAAVQEQVDKNTSDIAQRVDGNTFFAALMNIDAAINTKADKEQIGIINDHTMFNDVDDLTVYGVGGFTAGQSVKGLSVKEVLMKILYGYTVKKPDYEEPSATLTSINNTVGISSDSLTVTGTIAFDRGEILMNGEHQGYRAGHASSITITDPSTGEAKTVQLPLPTGERIENISFTYNLIALPLGDSEVKVKVNYDEGDQPLDSSGHPFEGPLPAGSIEMTFTVVGVTNTWSGLSVDDTQEVNNIDGTPVVDPDKYDPDHPDKGQVEGLFKELNSQGKVITSGFQMKTDEPTGQGQVPTILVQEDVEITGIKIWDPIQGEWHWYSNSTSQEATKEGSLAAFIKLEETVTKKINNDQVEIVYSVYQYAGDLAGEMYFRFYID